MKNEKLFEALTELDEKDVAEARMPLAKKTRTWTYPAAAAACLCLVAGTVFVTAGQRNRTPTQTTADLSVSAQTSAGISAQESVITPEQYFANADTGEENAAAVSSDTLLPETAIPYAESRDFSDHRAAWEADRTIPAVETHDIFEARAYYNADGSLYSVEISWHRRDDSGLANYSDLTVTAAYDAVPELRDEFAVELDENGNAVEPGVTVTERDGVRIVTTGGKTQEKTITYQTDSGWYRITGSWNDSYEAVVELLDWFWAHPLDLSRF